LESAGCRAILTSDDNVFVPGASVEEKETVREMARSLSRVSVCSGSVLIKKKNRIGSIRRPAGLNSMRSAQVGLGSRVGLSGQN